MLKNDSSQASRHGYSLPQHQVVKRAQRNLGPGQERGEAKSEMECNVICRPHCKAFGSAGECSECHKKCNLSPPSLMTKILKNQNNSKQDDLIN
ncbi:unnamed protein product [Brassica rapa subsp. narinosa]